MESPTGFTRYEKSVMHPALVKLNERSICSWIHLQGLGLTPGNLKTMETFMIALSSTQLDCSGNASSRDS